MTFPLLNALLRELPRLLAAGASTARTDERLRRLGQALQTQAGKVKACGRLAEAVAAVQQDRDGQVAAALLELLGLVRLAGSSLATAGIPGPLIPVPRAGPWQTPFPSQDVAQVAQALQPKGKDRDTLINAGLKRGLFADLRLASPCLDCLSNDSGLRHEAAIDGLPQLGPAVLPELRQALDLNGKTVDARRLAILCRIDRAVGSELCRLALKPGSNPKRRRGGGPAKSSVPVLVEAMRRVPDLLPPDEVEQLGLAFHNDGDHLLRGAALLALSGATSAEACECLLDALDSPYACKALAALPNPATTPRLLELLNAAAAGLTRRRRPPRNTGSPGSKPVDSQQERLRRIEELARILGQRQDDRREEVAAVLVELSRHWHEHVRRSALGGLIEMGAGSAEVMPRLIEILESPFKIRCPPFEVHQAVWALRKVPCAEREPAIPVLLRLARQPGLKGDFHRDVNLVLPCPDSPHLDAIRAVLVHDMLKHQRDDSSGVGYWSLRGLGELGPAAREDIPAILEYFAHQEWDEFWEEEHVLRVLPRIDLEGTVAIPGLIGLLRHRNETAGAIAVKMLAAYGPLARPALPLIADLAANSRRWSVQDNARQALALIQGIQPPTE